MPKYEIPEPPEGIPTEHIPVRQNCLEILWDDPAIYNRMPAHLREFIEETEPATAVMIQNMADEAEKGE